MNEEEVKMLRMEKTGRLWPHYKGKKALSASSLTKVLREIEYEEIPQYILLRAAARGENFHKTVQTFVKTSKHPSFVDLKINNLDKQLETKIHETINFLKNNKEVGLDYFLGSETLHYTFHNDELLASYIDLEFHDCIIELKSNKMKIDYHTNLSLKNFDEVFDKHSCLPLLIFEIQLLIQYLCTGKTTYLLWSTGKGVIFNRFKYSYHYLKILDVLIELVRNDEEYSSDAKKIIVEEIINYYYEWIFQKNNMYKLIK